MQAWDKFLEIKHAQSEDVQELLNKLVDDVRNVNEELAEYTNTLMARVVMESVDEEFQWRILNFSNLLFDLDEEIISNDGESIQMRHETDDYDSEGDTLFFEELLTDDSLSLPEHESFLFESDYDPSSPRPPAKPPDDDKIEPDMGLLTTKMVGIRISRIRTKNEAKNDKTEHEMEKREKSKSKSKSTKKSTKSKSKSTPTKVKVTDEAETIELGIPTRTHLMGRDNPLSFYYEDL
ncbi:hypothetical protein Tco_0184047 [Tanacetum coccineum]